MDLTRTIDHWRDRKRIRWTGEGEAKRDREGRGERKKKEELKS